MAPGKKEIRVSMIACGIMKTMFGVKLINSKRIKNLMQFFSY